MGKLSPTGVDQANQLTSGTFTTSGVSASIPMYGSFNVVIWAHLTSNTLTTTNGNTTASIGTNTGVSVGQYIDSANVPVGSTIGAASTNTVNINFPPGFTNGNLTTGVDSNAIFGPVPWGGAIQLERSLDGGKAFIACGVGGSGQSALYTGSIQAGAPISFVASEPEVGVLYRLNCVSYVSGSIRYRISTSGLAAMAWGVPPG